ncbi:MAG: hypothetical protein CMM32_00510 [Rhodospirillaceae bacterium]|nr:hypothetical protein [Rhodospirillaceae bacterium]|tara:strand:+ start:239 stop:1162 length:924 start_codon:yes stop_codon:yes gene_type:complete
MGYKVGKGNMPFASHKISTSIRGTSGTGIIWLLVTLLLTSGWLNPAKSQEPVVIGSSQPQIQVNEEAVFVRDYQGTNVGPRLPLFDPTKDTLKSRVIYLPQAVSNAPNPQVNSTNNSGKELVAPAPITMVEINETGVIPDPSPQTNTREERGEPELSEKGTATPIAQAQSASSRVESTDKELAAIPPNSPGINDRSDPSNTKSILTGPLTIIFKDGEKDIRADETDKLAAFANELVANGSTRLQLRSYASDVNESASAARRLSLARALAVRSFLIEAGVNSTRIDVRALGAKNEDGPADRVDLVVAN